MSNLLKIMNNFYDDNKPYFFHQTTTYNGDIGLNDNFIGIGGKLAF